jgi:predicted Rossmann fold flavoprotein
VTDEATYDIAVVGAGAAGLMAAIAAGRAARDAGSPLRIMTLDGARKLGAKILVAGGGRCNVTHDSLPSDAYAGGSPNTIRQVIRRFDIERTIGFFRELGVELKREETGKLFPTTDRARTVLDALLRAADEAGVSIRYPHRVGAIAREGGGFVLEAEAGTAAWGPMRARRVVLATGGRALPKTGSDGGGYALAKGLGHTITPRVFPALAPLILDGQSPLRALSGIAAEARLELRSGSGKRLTSFTNAVLCTHFGLSGPAAMDMSRHLTAARFDDPDAHCVVSWLPDLSVDDVEAALRDLGKRTVGRFVRDRLAERLAAAVCTAAEVDGATTGAQLTKDARRRLATALTAMRLPITGDRGFTHAEATAGGVPLTEIKATTMASKVCDGLHLCGEICDVDGRIGGFNFQWAWSSGHLAGTAAAKDVIAASA